MIVGIISEKKGLIVKYLIYENIIYDIINELNVCLENFEMYLIISIKNLNAKGKRIFNILISYYS